MKKTLCMLAIISCFCFAKCRKNKEPELPPVTTTGAMTFGCKINGKVFVPRNGRGKPGLYCQYVNLGNGPGGGWNLTIPATDWKPNPPHAVQIRADSLLIIEGGTYDFMLDDNYKNIKGYFSVGVADEIGRYLKSNSDDGSIHVIKFDQINRIIAGTFFFTATSVATGEKVSVTDGRFDIRY